MRVGRVPPRRALYANVYPIADVLPPAERAAAAFEAREPARAYFALYLVLQLRMRLQAPFDRDAVIARMERLERREWSELTRRFLAGHRVPCQLRAEKAHLFDPASTNRIV